MIPSLEPRLSSSYSSLAFRTVSGKKLDESLGSRLRDSSTTAALAADVGGEYTSVRLAGQWGCGKFLVCVGFAIALVSRLRSYSPPAGTVHMTRHGRENSAYIGRRFVQKCMSH